MKNELTTLTNDITPIVSEALSLSITSTSDMTHASALREQLKNTIAIVETVKETQYRPIKDKLDEVTGKFKPLEKMLKEATDKLSKDMGVYQTRIIAEAKAEADRIAARVGVGKGHLKPETAMEKIANIETVPVLDETNFINRPKLSITDINKIPREYLIVDEKKLEADLKSGKVVAGATLVDSYEPRTR